MIGIIKREEERWKIIGMYVRKEGLEKILGELEQWMEERKEEGSIIIAGISTQGQKTRMGE